MTIDVEAHQEIGSLRATIYAAIEAMEHHPDKAREILIAELGELRPHEKALGWSLPVATEESFAILHDGTFICSEGRDIEREKGAE